MPCENKLASGLVKTEKSCWAAAYEQMGQQQAGKEGKTGSMCTCKKGCKHLNCN